jgi:hypothetical protein
LVDVAVAIFHRGPAVTIKLIGRRLDDLGSGVDATSSTTIRGIIDLFGASSAMKPILDDRHDYGHDIF